MTAEERSGKDAAIEHAHYAVAAGERAVDRMQEVWRQRILCSYKPERSGGHIA